jgi:hypothetical protein
MKSELTQIQTALNACRISLDNLSVSDNISLQTQPDRGHIEAIAQNKKKHQTTSSVKQKRTQKCTKRMKKKSSFLFKPKQKLRRNRSIIFSSTLDTSQMTLSSSSYNEINYDYPLSSAYNFLCSSPTSNYLRSAKSKIRNTKPYLTPISYNNDSSKAKVTRKKSILINKKNQIRTFNQTSQNQFLMCPNNNNSYTNINKKNSNKNANCTKLGRFRRIEQTRNEHGYMFQNLVNINASNPNISSEKSLLKYRNLSPISSSRSQYLNPTNGPLSSPLKDHFIVVNHKNNQSTFEPQVTSTPILKEPKTSTPNVTNKFHLENVLKSLAKNNQEINDLITLKFIKYKYSQGNKLSDYFSASSSSPQNVSDYDIPEPRYNKNEYQIPMYSNKDSGLNFVSSSESNNNSDKPLLQSQNSTGKKQFDSPDSLLTTTQNSPKEKKTVNTKNGSFTSNTSSVALFKCCIKPFKNLLVYNKNLKKYFK